MQQRAKQIESLIKQELGELISKRFSRSGFGLVTITAVEINSHYTDAKIFMHCTENKEELVPELKRNIRFFRQGLNKRLRIKKIPQLKFILDKSPEHSEKIDEILKEIKEK